jgi:hypothetical protein
MSRVVCFLLLLLAGCATPRFADVPVVWRLDDQRAIAEPEENEFALLEHYADVFVAQRLRRGLSLADPEAARDVNALDEVPDSTWFENRIGLRPLDADHVARGAGGPPPALPLTVVSGKSGGANPGFIAEDATGRRYLVKFDDAAHPEMQTAAAAIASRLFWAMGYHVPSEHVFEFDPKDLLLEAEAKLSNAKGEKVLFSHAALDETVAAAPRDSRGRVRALGSLLLEGSPKGGFSPWGRRRDDPNDTVAHEHRRVLRGLRVFCAWLDHADINEQNTLDTYLTEGGRSYLRHHLVDFGETLGALFPERPWVSHAHMWDWEYHGLAIFTFGLWRRPWEGLPPRRPLLGVGRFPGEGWDPTEWQETKPYRPFVEATPADLFWAAKIVMRFRRSHLAAAVDTGRLSHAASRRYLLETLIARRDAIGRAFLLPLTTADRFTLENKRLCMDDLAVKYRLQPQRGLEVTATGERIALDGKGRGCISIGDDAYQVIRLGSKDPERSPVPIEVHVKGGAEARVLGILRETDFR